MKKIILLLAVVLLFSNQAFAKSHNAASQSSGVALNVAVVDVSKIVENSPAIAELNKERKNKLSDLEQFVLNARKDVTAQKTDEAKKSLENKYNKELNERKDTIDRDFAKKLAEIDKNTTALINIKAQKMGYNLILVKSSVLGGGTDITSDIIKEIK